MFLVTWDEYKAVPNDVKWSNSNGTKCFCDVVKESQTYIAKDEMDAISEVTVLRLDGKTNVRLWKSDDEEARFRSDK
jgi:hypothetical protein